jgi:hypothetical protein
VGFEAQLRSVDQVKNTVILISMREVLQLSVSQQEAVWDVVEAH